MVERLTTRMLDALKAPSSGQVERFDSGCTGLSIRVGKSGRKAWCFLYRDGGKRSRETLGTYPSLSLADARERAEEIRRGLVKGITPRQQASEKKRAGTVSVLFDDYERRHAKTNKRSWRKDRLIFDKDIKAAIGDMAPGDVRRRHIVAMLDSIVDRGAPIQANRTLEIIRRVYSWAMGRDLVELNPCSGIPKPTDENQRDRVLTDDEVRAFWAACEGEPVHTGHLFKIRLLTATRGAEVKTMAWADIEGDWWTVPASVSKNRLSHRVWLSPMVRGLLDDLKNNSSWVFPSARDPEQPRSAIHKAHGRIRTRAKIADFVPHDLRRTAATHMGRLGISRFTIGRVLNHVDTGTTATYDRASYDGDKMRALDAWAQKLQAILECRNISEGNVIELRGARDG